VSAIIVLTGSKLLASSIAASLARIGSARGFIQTRAALEALGQAASAVLILCPRFGRVLDLTPMRRLAEVNPSARSILLVDEEVELVADASPDLPPHCRISLSGDLEGLIACIREGRSRYWGRAKGVGKDRGEARVILPDRNVLTAAQAAVLRLHCLGHSAVQIAQIRGGSARPIETHMRTIRAITGATNNVVLAVRYATWAPAGEAAPG
jgi:DNA-binding CsgD family transcriptional regulator